MVFNSGSQSLTQVMDKVGVAAGPVCQASLAKQDKVRLLAASYVVSEKVKQRRKSKRRLKKGAEEALVEEEGVTYEAGAF